MDITITTLTDVKINKGISNIKVKTYYHNFDELPYTILAFVNDTPNFLFDYMPFKVGKLGIKMINHPLFIDFHVNKSGELVVFGPFQSEINRYSLGGTDIIDLIYDDSVVGFVLTDGVDSIRKYVQDGLFVIDMTLTLFELIQAVTLFIHFSLFLFSKVTALIVCFILSLHPHNSISQLLVHHRNI